MFDLIKHLHFHCRGEKPFVEFNWFFSNGDLFAFFLYGRQKEGRATGAAARNPDFYAGNNNLTYESTVKKEQIINISN